MKGLAAGVVLGGLCLWMGGCVPETCRSVGTPSLALGQGVGGFFEPLSVGQEVGLVAAPQGGMGVPVLVRTIGLVAGDEELADVQLDTVVNGDVTGSFLSEDARLLCRGDGAGGEISGVVVGFNDEDYPELDDLLQFNGQAVDLDVTVFDDNGGSASVVQSVTILVGG